MPKKYAFERSFWVDGKRYTVRADTKEELIRKEALKRRDIAEGKVLRGGDTKVKDYIDQCYDLYRLDASERTRQSISYEVQKHIVPSIGHLPLRAVTRAQCQSILNAQSGKSHALIRILRHELGFIFDSAVQDELILKSPAVNLKTPPCAKGERRALTSEERQHFLKVCAEDRSLDVFLLMLYCGCRPAEAIECRRSDITEIDDGVYRLHIRGTKTKNADRSVPLPGHLWERFKDLPPDSPLAVSQSGKKHTESSYRCAIARLRRAMNISMGCKVYRNQLIPPLPLADDFVPYDLRHTYCTDLAHARVDIRIAKTLMGHSNITITANIYTHAGDTLDEVAESATLLDAYYKRKGEVTQTAGSEGV